MTFFQSASSLFCLRITLSVSHLLRVHCRCNSPLIRLEFILCVSTIHFSSSITFMFVFSVCISISICYVFSHLPLYTFSHSAVSSFKYLGSITHYHWHLLVRCVAFSFPLLVFLSFFHSYFSSDVMTIQHNGLKLQQEQQVKRWGAGEELDTKEAIAAAPLIDKSRTDPATLTYNGLKEIVQQQQNGAHSMEIPAEFVLPLHLQPGLSAKGDHRTVNLPLIDMSGVYDNPERRKQIVASIAAACSNWGFFQVVGHGVPEDLRQRTLALGREFFELPVSEKVKWSGEHKSLPMERPILGKTRTTSSGNHSWRDLFRHKIAPVSDAEVDEWPTTPESYRETVMEYALETMKLSTTLFELISEGLNLKSQHILEALGGADGMDHIVMLAYYPRCPQPDLALGVIGHTDPNLLTLLIQDDVGLEVKKDGFWVPVVPASNGFVVNIGDSFQIMTNDTYKSAEHRVVTTDKRDRISVMIFVQPQNHVNVSVVHDLVPSNKTAIYNDISWAEHLKYARQGLDNKLTKFALK